MSFIFSDIEKYSQAELINKINKTLSLSRKFSGDYNLSVLENMSLDEYAHRRGNRKNFCYRIIWELELMGRIKSLHPPAFGVWYDAKSDGYKYAKKYGNSLEEAWEKVRAEIIKLIRAGAKEDYVAIRESVLPPLFKYKILAVYYSNQYITIYADSHLCYFCNKLGITFSAEDDTLILQRKLVLWKEEHNAIMKMSLLIYVKWLYDTFGQPPKTKRNSTHNKQLRILFKQIEDFDNKYPNAKTVEVLKRDRSELISAYVKERANGVCQLCRKPAPFYNKNGEPYLECHHIVWIEQNGIDEPNNAVALCPNCHRKMHILDNENDIKYLKNQAQK